MRCPVGLQPLLDGDIIRYELGFAAETGWRAITNDSEALPPFSYVADLLHDRIDTIKRNVFTEKDPIFYITKGRTIRYDIAKRKPYKAQRVENKPFHFDNLTAYLVHMLGARVIEYIEADDALAIDHIASNGTTILCSRDKDLKQVPGWFYSWELGKQGSFGPINIDLPGTLTLSDDHKKLSGTGYSWFLAQCLIGDSADNTPGLPKCGPVQAYQLLTEAARMAQERAEGIPGREVASAQLQAVYDAYSAFYGPSWEQELLEQGQLHWLIRRLGQDGKPQLWELGMIE